MKVNFKDIIEEIKESSVNQEETMEYILAIKKVLDRATQNCKSEEEKQEVLQQFIEEYEKDLAFRGNAEKIFNGMLMHNTYKRVLNMYTGNKSTFDSVLRESRRRENNDNKEAIMMKTETKEGMISAVRFIIRTKGVTKEKDILAYIQQEKGQMSQSLKSRMIDTIHFCISTLDEYGIIDEYIRYSNEELEQLGLSELKLNKRNPIADEEYDKEGNLVKDAEDIGVMDAFSADKLKEMPLEDLEIMTAFWESKYLQHRIGISKAKSVIATLGLWDTILNKDEKTIQSIDKGKIDSALRKDLAVTYLCKDGSEITNRMEKQYRKFLENEGISSEVKLEDEVKAVAPEVTNLSETARDIAILEGLRIYQLEKKELKIKKWGVISEKKDEKTSNEQTSKGFSIAIENKNFRGPLIMEIPKEVLRKFLSNEQAELPKYDKDIDDAYCRIMSMLYMPSNKYFTTVVKKAYEENPKSQLLADLAGKKVKKGQER